MSFDLIQAMMLRHVNYEYLLAEQRRRNTADLQGKTQCVRCGYCCVQRTCVPIPDELPGIAEFLGLTVAELVATYMIGDTVEGHYFLRFANIAQKDIVGQFVSVYRSYDRGPCMLLHDEEPCTCKIWPVRPQDAKEATCWADSEDRYAAARQWKKGDLERICPNMDIDNEDDWDDDWDDESPEG